MRIGDGELTYPVPWATTSALNAVAKPAQYREALEKAGFAIIAVVVLISASFAFAAAAFLRRVIVSRLERLTDHVKGSSGALEAITDSAFVRSPDELGDLARAFNRMVGELDEARRAADRPLRGADQALVICTSAPTNSLQSLLIL